MTIKRINSLSCINVVFLMQKLMKKMPKCIKKNILEEINLTRTDKKK